MSLIRVDNFGPSAGGTTYSAAWVTKAALHFYQATNTTINSYNISSVTDNATGENNIYFTNAFSAADYMSTATVNTGANNNTTFTNNQLFTASAIQLQCSDADTSTTGDYPYSALFHGDLA